MHNKIGSQLDTKYKAFYSNGYNQEKEKQYW